MAAVHPAPGPPRKFAAPTGEAGSAPRCGHRPARLAAIHGRALRAADGSDDSLRSILDLRENWLRRPAKPARLRGAGIVPPERGHPWPRSIRLLDLREDSLRR